MKQAILAALVLAAPAIAHADVAAGEEFGAKGTIILSADRVSPLFSYAHNTLDGDNGDTTTTTNTSLNFLWNGAQTNFYDIPRAGFDVAVAPNFTIGGTLFATLPMSASQDAKRGNTTTSTDQDQTSAFGIGGRAGYVISLTPRISFWPRGGLSYTYTSTKSPENNNASSQSSTSQLALNLEPLLVFSPAHHVGIQIGPVLDVPLTGNRHDEATLGPVTTSADHDVSQLHFGITAGLLGWF